MKKALVCSLLSFFLTVLGGRCVTLAATDIPATASLRYGPVTVRHSPSDEALAERLARRAELIHRRIREDLGLEREVDVDILLLTSGLSEEVARSYERPLAPWVAGTAYAGKRLIVLRIGPGNNISEQERLLAHELTHVILQGDYPLSGSWPRWFQEGLAMRESGGEGFRRRAILSFAALRGRLLPLESLDGVFPDNEADTRLAYAQSFSVITFLHARFGKRRFQQFMAELRSEPFETAFGNVYGMGLGRMEKRWRRFVMRRYNWVPLLTGATAFWSLTLLIFFLALAARRRKDRLLRETWEKEEARPSTRYPETSGGEHFPEE